MLKGWRTCIGVALWCVSQPAFAGCTLAKVAELPVTMSGLRPLVPAKINGVDKMFLADSGAFFSALNASTAAELKLKAESARGFVVEGAGGMAAADVVKVKVFTLAQQSISNAGFIVLGGLDGDAAGMLGQNILGLTDVEYDLANGTIRLMEPRDCGEMALAYWNHTNDFAEMDIQPSDLFSRGTIGTAYVNDVKLQVMFDTGASTSMITLAAAARAGITPNSPGVRPGGVTYGIGRHLVNTWIAPVASFKIGGEEILKTSLRIGDFTLDRADMLVGADFFLSHRVYVSNLQHKLYFTYNGGAVFNLTSTAASAAAQTAVGPEPSDAEGFDRRGAALAARHDFNQAIADFSRAIALAPSESRYFYQRAVANLQVGHAALGKADLDQALKFKPDDVTARFVRAEFQMQAHDTSAALADLDAASAAATKEADIRLLLGQLYADAGRPDDAIPQLDDWIATHADSPQMVMALNSRCWARTLAARDIDLAVKDCDRALHMGPKDASFFDSRGLAHLRLGQWDQAIADYDSALALDPKLAWSLYGRGLAKAHKGLKAEADADLAASVVLDPNLPAEAKKYGIVGPEASQKPGIQPAAAPKSG